MLIGLLQGIGIFYYWTWFIWSFVFVFSLVHAITSLVKDDKASMKPTWGPADKTRILYAKQ